MRTAHLSIEHFRAYLEAPESSGQRYGSEPAWGDPIVTWLSDTVPAWYRIEHEDLVQERRAGGRGGLCCIGWRRWHLPEWALDFKESWPDWVADGEYRRDAEPRGTEAALALLKQVRDKDAIEGSERCHGCGASEEHVVRIGIVEGCGRCGLGLAGARSIT